LETNSSVPYEPEFDPLPDGFDEVDAQPGAHPRDDENSEAFRSPDWD
jgi:hypothetical protein